MPRPSCRIYSKIPFPSCSILSNALCNCGPQSQLSEPKTSPVKHSECIRNKTEDSCDGLLIMQAMYSLPSLLSVYTIVLKDPNLVGSWISASLFTSDSCLRRYLSIV